MSPAPRRTLPWSISDARTAAVPIAFGGVLLAWGWWDASGTGKLDNQTTAVVFAVLAAGGVVAGSLAWLAAGRRAVEIRRRELIDLLEQHLLGSAGSTADMATDDVVTVRGTSRYHRADCLLVLGKDVQRLAPDTGAAGGKKPCEMCRP